MPPTQLSEVLNCFTVIVLTIVCLIMGSYMIREITDRGLQAFRRTDAGAATIAMLAIAVGTDINRATYWWAAHLTNHGGNAAAFIHIAVFWASASTVLLAIGGACTMRIMTQWSHWTWMGALAGALMVAFFVAL